MSTTATRPNTRTYARVTAIKPGFRAMSPETETEVKVYDLSGDGCTQVAFELTWGRKGGRDFELEDHDDIRALARVLAHAAGTELADEADEEA